MRRWGSEIEIWRVLKEEKRSGTIDRDKEKERGRERWINIVTFDDNSSFNLV